MSPLRSRFEGVGLHGQDAATWFAMLLRDGFALTVTGATPSCAALAPRLPRGFPVRACLRRGPRRLRRGHGRGHCRQPRQARPARRRGGWHRGPAGSGTQARDAQQRRNGTRGSALRRCRHSRHVREAAHSGGRTRMEAGVWTPTATPSPRVASAWPARRCWSRYIRGTSREPITPVWPRRGSTVRSLATRATSPDLTSKPRRSWTWRINWQRGRAEKAQHARRAHHSMPERGLPLARQLCARALRPPVRARSQAPVRAILRASRLERSRCSAL